MPKSSKTKLAYMAEYQKQPAVAEKGVERRRARRHAIADGRAAIGDGTNVDHIKPLGAGGSGKDSNTRVISEARNKGWRKGESSYKPKKV